MSCLVTAIRLRLHRRPFRPHTFRRRVHLRRRFFRLYSPRSMHHPFRNPSKLHHRSAIKPVDSQRHEPAPPPYNLCNRYIPPSSGQPSHLGCIPCYVFFAHFVVLLLTLRERATIGDNSNPRNTLGRYGLPIRPCWPVRYWWCDRSRCYECEKVSKVTYPDDSKLSL